MKKYSIFLLAALLSISPLGFAQTLHSMSKKQLAQAFIGKTVSAIFFNESTKLSMWTGHFNKQGQITIKISDNSKNDHGTYKIKDNGEICISLYDYRNSSEACYYVYDTKNAYLLVDTQNRFSAFFKKNKIHSENFPSNREENKIDVVPQPAW